MAKKLNISPSYLSSIEIGERNMPERFFEKIKSSNIFRDKELEEIQSSTYETKKIFKFRPKSDSQKSLVANLIRGIDNLTEEQMKAMMDVLENNKTEQ
jgi:transcriptional regulator with XRE-family HTH domain